jgi:hypothetical protein
MKQPRLRDVFSHQGRDFLVEGLLTYKLGARTLKLARVVDGDDVRFVEPLTDDADDRLLVLAEVTDLRVGTPPPATISYKGGSYVPRLSGSATVTIDGAVTGRTGGSCELWRYRAAGDLFLQIERWASGTVFLAGESVHKDMVDFLPAP